MCYRVDCGEIGFVLAIAGIDMMTDKESVAAVKSGGRCKNKHTIWGLEVPDQKLHFSCVHNWRTVACDDSETDVVECSRCGWQRVCACSFDDDFA